MTGDHAERGGQDSAREHEETRPGWPIRSHALVAVLCALLGFALVLQVRQTSQDEFSAMRQDDLVRLLDEISQRSSQLEEEREQLLADRADLRSGTDAQEVAERNALVQGILAGAIAASGPGIELEVTRADSVRASAWVHLVEELRNAGAEAIEIGGVRVAGSSWFVDDSRGVIVDGVRLSSPVQVVAIGEPQTLEVALGIPGGALATIRSAGAETDLVRADEVHILSTRELTEPEFATPAPQSSADSG